MPSNNRLTAGVSFGKPVNLPTIPIGYAPYNSTGTETTGAATGTLYVGTIWVPCDCNYGGFAVLMGSTALGRMCVGLWDQNGSLITGSVAAGIAVTAADYYQFLNFSTTPFIAGPGRYHVGFQVSSNCRIRVVSDSSWVHMLSASTVGTFGTLGTITPPVGIGINTGPIGMLTG